MRKTKGLRPKNLSYLYVKTAKEEEEKILVATGTLWHGYDNKIDASLADFKPENLGHGSFPSPAILPGVKYVTQ